MGIVTNQSIKNSIYFYIGMFFGALSTVILYPNVFDVYPENLGLFQIIVAYSTIITTFSYLGTPKTIIRFFPKIDNKNELISLSIIIPLIGFLLLVFFYFLFQDQFFMLFKVTDDLFKNQFHLVFLLVAFLSFFEVFSALSRSLLNATLPIFLKEVFLKGMTVLLLTLHWIKINDLPIIDFYTFLYLYISLYLCMTLILLYSIFTKFNYRFTLRFNELQTKKLFKYGIYVLVGGSSAMLVSKLDMILIHHFIDLEHVAFYSIAFFIGNVIFTPSRAIGSITSPLISKAWKNNDIKEIKDIYVKSSLNQLLLGGLLFLGIWLNIDEGLSLLPSKFQGGKYVILFIGLSKLFSVATGVNGQVIINSKYYRFDLYSNIFLFVIALIANIIFIPESSPLIFYGIHGINGAAFATALSVITFNTIKLIFVYIKVGIHPFNLQTIKAVLLIFFTFSIVNSIPFSDNIIYHLLFKSLLILSIYFPFMLFFRISDDLNKISFKFWKKYIG